MKRLLLAATLAAAWGGSAGAYVETLPYGRTPAGGNQYGLAVASSTALSSPAGASYAQITVEGQSIRCTTDGTTTPTSTAGVLYQAGTVITVYGDLMHDMRCIQTAATATLDVEYFR